MSDLCASPPKDAFVAFGSTGLWAGFLDDASATEAVATAQRLEAAGVRAVWLQEHSGLDPFVRAALYLAGTERLGVGLGVAVIHGRDPEGMVAAAATIEEAFPGRFVLGLGVSHRRLVEARGHAFTPPIPTMERYLAAMDTSGRKRSLPPRVLGALGPRMLELAGRCADGAHTYLMPVAHTAAARAALGPDRWLAPTQLVAVDGDGPWRDTVRTFIGWCVKMPNYARGLARYGFDADDVATITDRLVDAVVVPNDAGAITARIEEHRDAGADHVVVQYIPRPPADAATVTSLVGSSPRIFHLGD